MRKADYPTLSVVIPAHNEEKTIAEIIRRVRAVKLDKEIIVVDDGSTDKTAAILRTLESADLKVIAMPRNSGKGAAIQAGFKQAQNEIIIIQDADLEYDPGDYYEIMEPFQHGGWAFLGRFYPPRPRHPGR